MLTGGPPFTGGSLKEIALRILRSPFPSVRAVRPDLPAGVERAARAVPGQVGGGSVRDHGGVRGVALSAGPGLCFRLSTLLERTRVPDHQPSGSHSEVAAPPDTPPTVATDAVFGLASAVGLGIAALALVLFGWLADEMLEGDTLAFDMHDPGAAHAIASPGLTQTMVRLRSRLGGPPVLAGVGIVLLGGIRLAPLVAGCCSCCSRCAARAS